MHPSLKTFYILLFCNWYHENTIQLQSIHSIARVSLLPMGESLEDFQIRTSYTSTRFEQAKWKTCGKHVEYMETHENRL